MFFFCIVALLEKFLKKNISAEVLLNLKAGDVFSSVSAETTLIF